MARKNKLSLEFHNFEEIIGSLEDLEGNIEKATEEALIASKRIVTENLKKATVKPNFPAQGKYSTGKTEESINTDEEVEWIGKTAQIPVGFNVDDDNAGLYLMYGTLRMAPVKEMHDAVYGNKTKKAVEKAQASAFDDAIADALWGF